MDLIDVIQSPNWSACLLSGLKDLYATGQMFDVELVENSGRSLWAHSCVLAAACPMMKNAFMQTAAQSPRRIFYADISIERWKQLLDFIYLGQVSVSRSQIPLLLNTASNLGLTELQNACKELLEQHNKERQQNMLVGKKKILKSPSASATRKRNMLERIPQSDQIPIILSVEEVEAEQAANKTPVKTKVEGEDDDDFDTGDVGDVENESPEKGEFSGVKKEKKEEKEESMYRCTKCNKDLPYGTSLFRHELRHKMFPNKKNRNKKGNFTCSKCPKKFFSKNSRNCHERNHNKKPKFECRHCDQRFFFEFVRDKHIIEKHADEDPEYMENNFICEEPDCEKAFATHALLRTHRSRAHGIKEESSRPDKPVPCDICNKEVLWLNEHKKSVHPEEMGESRQAHVCPDCGKVMKYASSLKRHMYIHQEGGAVNCPHCDKPFNHPSSLWSHFPSCPKIPLEEKVLLKSSVKKYKRKPKSLKCEICNKTFTNLRNYRNHVDNHLGKYKHICGHCGKKFQNTNHYSDHMNRHYGIKPHSCPHCDKTFASKSDMNQHIRQHTGERPFACPICNRTFVHRSNCYAHARKAHNKELSHTPDLVKTQMGDGTIVTEIHEAGDSQEGQAIVVTQEQIDKGEVRTVTVSTNEHNQETVQIAELLLAQHDKGQHIGGQTFTTINAADASGNTLNTVLVPQYMYSTTPATVTNIYHPATSVAGAGDFTAATVQAEQQQQQQQQTTAAGQPTEIKFCLYEG